MVAELRVDLDRAGRLAAAARFLAEQTGDETSRGRSLRAEAIVLTMRDENARALRRLEEALGCFERAGDERQAAITRSSAVQCLIHSGEYERALEWAAAARESFRRHDLPLLLLEAEYNVAYLYYLQGDYARALALFEVARRNSEQQDDRQHMALCDFDRSASRLGLRRLVQSHIIVETARSRPPEPPALPGRSSPSLADTGRRGSPSSSSLS